ncbi:MAG: UTRA domain-containing protein, partial [Ruminiclostridium sp.]|nr:UTRA domain-containing protein [Ruminiclostridium sp.]
KIEQRNIMSFSESVARKGLVPSTKVLHFSKEKIDEDIANILGLKPGENVFAIKRLRLAGGIPVGIEENFLPEKYCPGLDKYDLTSSMYRLIKEEYSFAISYVDNVIESSKPNRDEREQLGISNSVPVLRISGVNYTDANLKLFYERSVYRSDEYKYSVRVYVNKNIE